MRNHQSTSLLLRQECHKHNMKIPFLYFYNSRTIATLIQRDKFFGAGPKVSIIRTKVRRVYDDIRKKFEKTWDSSHHPNLKNRKNSCFWSWNFSLWFHLNILHKASHMKLIKCSLISTLCCWFRKARVPFNYLNICAKLLQSEVILLEKLVGKLKRVPQYECNVSLFLFQFRIWMVICMSSGKKCSIVRNVAQLSLSLPLDSTLQ